MVSFKKFIEEGITIKDNKIEIDYSDGGTVSTKMGKKNRIPYISAGKNVGGIEVFSGYLLNTQLPGTKDIMLALKDKHPEIVADAADVNQFLNRTAQYLLATAFKGTSIDLIITLKSSSDLVNRFADQFSVRIPNRLFFPSAIQKANIDKIKVADNVPNEKIRKDLQRVIDNVKSGKVNGFEIKKILTKDRQFVLDFLELDESLLKKIEGKHVLIIDDFLTSGATIAESARLISLYNPASIRAATIFKVK